ncbi:MAG: type II secretion system F family protein [Desulfosarcina sp.]|nr:type II secretion system F family protein [Desulfobacterales bacterium]
MQTFQCKAADQNGRIIEKNIVADSKASAKKVLDQEGYFALEINKKGGVFALIKQGPGLKNFKSKDFLFFNQEFSVLIRAGLSIVAALDIIIEKEDKSKLAVIIRKVRNDISTGESISGAFGKYPGIFPNLYIASLTAGEKNGDIPLAITRYIEYMKNTDRIRQQVISSSSYPLILLTGSCFVLLFLLMYVVPSLTESFLETDTKLPVITAILIDLSAAIRHGFFYIIFIISGILAAIFYFVKTEKGKIFFDRLKLKLPFLGELYLNYSISKLARTVASVLSGGIPLVESIRISSGTLNNNFLKLRLEDAVIKIKKGAGFADSLLTANFFPKLALRMISAGENSGALEQVLNEIADFYENSVDTKLSILTSAIEPALMAIMGLIIGFIVLAIYMPIFQLAAAIS